MKAVAAIIEDDAGRVMVLQDKDGTPILPRLNLEDTQGPLKELRRSIPADTGFEITGWAEMLTLSEGKHQYHFFRAHIASGRARHFPTEKYLSLSWVAPELAKKILEGEATQLSLRARYPYLY